MPCSPSSPPLAGGARRLRRRAGVRPSPRRQRHLRRRSSSGTTPSRRRCRPRAARPTTWRSRRRWRSPSAAARAGCLTMSDDLAGMATAGGPPVDRRRPGDPADVAARRRRHQHGGRRRRASPSSTAHGVPRAQHRQPRRSAAASTSGRSRTQGALDGARDLAVRGRLRLPLPDPAACDAPRCRSRSWPRRSPLAGLPAPGRRRAPDPRRLRAAVRALRHRRPRLRATPRFDDRHAPSCPPGRCRGRVGAAQQRLPDLFRATSTAWRRSPSASRPTDREQRPGDPRRSPVHLGIVTSIYDEGRVTQLLPRPRLPLARHRRRGAGPPHSTSVPSPPRAPRPGRCLAREAGFIAPYAARYTKF